MKDYNQLRLLIKCPYCYGDLDFDSGSYHCSDCNDKYPVSNNGQIDLRLKRDKNVNIKHNIVSKPAYDKAYNSFSLLKEKTPSSVDFSNISVPRHLSKEILSHFPKAKDSKSVVLDLGCGDGIHKKVCEHAGFTYIGMDYCGDLAEILGDAHALPFANNSFEFILSIAVLEHIRDPIVMMNEIKRVLKSGGKLIGTVAFLEPFHDNSYYHHSFIGVYNSLLCGGLNINQISPNENWTVLFAQAKTLFPGFPAKFAKLMTLPLYALHICWWFIIGLLHPKATNLFRLQKTCGSFIFIANKP